LGGLGGLIEEETVVRSENICIFILSFSIIWHVINGGNVNEN
jgi:hypothetical protein